MNRSNISTEIRSMTKPNVRVIGIGDTGVRAAADAAESLRGLAEVSCVDTDSTSLMRAGRARKLLIGERVFHGFGTGGDVSLAERAAKAQINALVGLVSGAECVVILAGMGGGAGSAIAPVVAAAAKLAGAHAVSIVTMPFEFEGNRRGDIARDALAKLKSQSDAVIPLSNDRLIASSGRASTMEDALRSGRRLNSVLVEAVSSVFSESRGYSRITPANVLSVLSGNASAYAGTGEGSGRSAAADAAEEALISPSSIDTCSAEIDRAIVLVESGQDLSLTQVAAAMGTVQAHFGERAELHMGVRERRELGDRVRVTVFAACSERRRPVTVTERPAMRRTFDSRQPIPMFG